MTEDTAIHDQRCRELLVSMRKIIQAIDIHSRTLNKRFGLTGPQLIILQEIHSHGEISVTPLSRITSLSQATVTDITKRLVSKGLVDRKTRKEDRRSVSLFLTPAGHEMMKNLPSPLQETFTLKFSTLADWEQMMILSAFERVVTLMSAEELDASPIMVTGPIRPD